VEIANGNREPARATALHGLADAGDVTGIGGSHRREPRRPVYATPSGRCSSRPRGAPASAADAPREPFLSPRLPRTVAMLSTTLPRVRRGRLVIEG